MSDNGALGGDVDEQSSSSTVAGSASEECALLESAVVRSIIAQLVVMIAL